MAVYCHNKKCKHVRKHKLLKYQTSLSSTSNIAEHFVTYRWCVYNLNQANIVSKSFTPDENDFVSYKLVVKYQTIDSTRLQLSLYLSVESILESTMNAHYNIQLLNFSGKPMVNQHIHRRFTIKPNTTRLLPLIQSSIFKQKDFFQTKKFCILFQAHVSEYECSSDKPIPRKKYSSLYRTYLLNSSHLDFFYWPNCCWTVTRQVAILFTYRFIRKQLSSMVFDTLKVSDLIQKEETSIGSPLQLIPLGIRNGQLEIRQLKMDDLTPLSMPQTISLTDWRRKKLCTYMVDLFENEHLLDSCSQSCTENSLIHDALVANTIPLPKKLTLYCKHKIMEIEHEIILMLENKFDIVSMQRYAARKIPQSKKDQNDKSSPCKRQATMDNSVLVHNRYGMTRLTNMLKQAKNATLICIEHCWKVKDFLNIHYNTSQELVSLFAPYWNDDSYKFGLKMNITPENEDSIEEEIKLDYTLSFFVKGNKVIPAQFSCLIQDENYACPRQQYSNGLGLYHQRPHIVAQFMQTNQICKQDTVIVQGNTELGEIVKIDMLTIQCKVYALDLDVTAPLELCLPMVGPTIPSHEKFAEDSPWQYATMCNRVQNIQSVTNSPSESFHDRWVFNDFQPPLMRDYVIYGVKSKCRKSKKDNLYNYQLQFVPISSKSIIYLQLVIESRKNKSKEKLAIAYKITFLHPTSPESNLVIYDILHIQVNHTWNNYIKTFSFRKFLEYWNANALTLKCNVLFIKAAATQIESHYPERLTVAPMIARVLKLGEWANVRFSFTSQKCCLSKQLFAHQAVLCARSPVFEAMFSHPTRENILNHVDIVDIDMEVFRILLLMMYTLNTDENCLWELGPFYKGTPVLKNTNVTIFYCKFLYAAVKYQFKEAITVCVKWLKSITNPKTAIDLLFLADQLDLQDLKVFIMNYIHHNRKELNETNELARIRDHRPSLLLDLYVDIPSVREPTITSRNNFSIFFPFTAPRQSLLDEQVNESVDDPIENDNIDNDMNYYPFDFANYLFF